MLPPRSSTGDHFAMSRLCRSGWSPAVAGALSSATAGDQPDLHSRDIAKWSPVLERGGSIELVRRLCDRQKATWLLTHTEPAPELVPAGTLQTYGPLPDVRAQGLRRTLIDCADASLKIAEEMQVETLADARAQLSELLTADKATVAAAAMADGRYWTIDPSTQPRLPNSHTYWRLRVNDAFGDGRTLDVFVPLDLTSADLAPTYEALLSLEEELRVDYAAEFNAMPIEERQALAETAWRGARGAAIDRGIPDWFWKLNIDRLSWRATPRPTQS